MSEEGDMDTATAGIETTTADQVEHKENVVHINQDKLAKVDDKTIVEAFDEMVQIDDARQNLNDKAGEIRSRLKNLGIPTAAFNAAYSRFKKTEAKRLEQDAGYAKCCKATGTWFQESLL